LKLSEVEYNTICERGYYKCNQNYKFTDETYSIHVGFYPNDWVYIYICTREWISYIPLINDTTNLYIYENVTMEIGVINMSGILYKHNKTLCIDSVKILNAIKHETGTYVCKIEDIIQFLDMIPQDIDRFDIQKVKDIFLNIDGSGYDWKPLLEQIIDYNSQHVLILPQIII